MFLDNEFHVTTIALRRFEHRLALPSPTPAGGWLVAFADQPDVICFDSDLNEIWRLTVKIERSPYRWPSVALSPDEQTIAYSTETDLYILDRNGTIRYSLVADLNNPYTGSECMFDTHNRLWFVQRGDLNTGSDRLLVLEPTSGAILFQQTLANERGHFYLYPCPDRQSVLLDEACGQDGSFLYLACIRGDGLGVTRLGFDDRTFFWGFAPNGREFATGAHHAQDSLKIHSFPQGTVIAAVDSQPLFATERLVSEYPDSVGYQALYVNDDYLVTETRWKRLILVRRSDLALMGTIWAEGDQLRGYDDWGRETADPKRIGSYEADLTYICPAGPGRVLAIYKEKTMRLLDLAPVLVTAGR